MEHVHKRILVTGGAGFLGSHLCEYLLNAGAHVICVDNLATGSYRHIESLSQYPHFQFIKHDVIHPLADIGSIDEIYNLACPASPYQYQKNPIQTLKTSVYGAANMLELAHRLNAKILQTSTSEVYGDPQVHPQIETYFGYVNPLGMRACYEEGKRAAETLFIDYFRQYQLNIKIARLFNVYGPRMQADDGRVIPNFILQALQDKPITIYGDGKQTRSFCYVDDIIRGLTQLMATDNTFTGPINIGNTHEMTMLELAQTIIDITGSQSSFAFKPTPPGDPGRRKPDVQLAQQILRWAPVTSLADGLKQTISHFEAVVRSPDYYPALSIG